jgi:O-antigen ligase
MLGLGALICFWRLLWAGSGCGARLVSAGLMLGLATQSALTFSRGGLYAAGTSVVLAALYLARDTRSRLRLVLIAGLVGLAAHYVIVPGLDSFTGGALTQRFTDTSATGRFEIVSADLQVWQQSPLLGSGPGGARAAEETEQFFGHAAAAHTEFARLLAEHGALGVGALVVLAFMSLRNLRCAPTVRARALVVSLLGWSLLFMGTSAMRVVAPALLFGASFMAIEAPEQP